MAGSGVALAAATLAVATPAPLAPATPATRPRPRSAIGFMSSASTMPAGDQVGVRGQQPGTAEHVAADHVAEQMLAAEHARRARAGDRREQRPAARPLAPAARPRGRVADRRRS